MGRIARSQEYENVLNLAEAGQYDKALNYLKLHLDSCPDDVEAFNDTGTVLYCMGRVDEAIEHFEKALNLSDKPASAEIYWNLCQACIDGQYPQRAVELLEEMDAIEILSPDIMNRLADCFLQNESFGPAVEMLLRSLQMSPNQEILYPMIEVLRSKRPRIAFFCQRGDGRISDIYEYINKRFPCELHSSPTNEQVNNITEWADICWFEGLTEEMAQFLLRERRCKVIVRVTAADTDRQLPAYINFNNIYALIATDQSVKQYLEKAGFNPDAHNTKLIVTGESVDTQRCAFTNKQRGNNLACLDGLNFKSNPMFLLQCMQKLHFIDPQYRLFFAGHFEDSLLEKYLRYMVFQLNLTDVVFFDGQVDAARWLADKHYIVSAALTDADFHSIRKGMACGLKPVISNFPGAETLLDRRFMFNISEDFCRLVLDESFDPQTYRALAGSDNAGESTAQTACEIIQQLEEDIPRPTHQVEPDAGSIQVDVQGISVSSYTPPINELEKIHFGAPQVQMDVSVYSNSKVIPIMPISPPSVLQLEAESQPVDTTADSSFTDPQDDSQNVQRVPARHSVKRESSIEQIAAKALRASESLTRMINERSGKSQNQMCSTDGCS